MFTDLKKSLSDSNVKLRKLANETYGNGPFWAHNEELKQEIYQIYQLSLKLHHRIKQVEALTETSEKLVGGQ